MTAPPAPRATGTDLTDGLTDERAPRSALRRWALASLVTNVGIVVTGGLVRVTGSGLGCPTWPTCEPGSVLPRPGAEPGWHQLVEFGNRTLTGVVLVAVVGAFVAARRSTPAGTPERRLSALLVGGVLTQAVLGGVTVLLELHPLIVAAHFLLSTALIAVATLLHRRTRGEVAAVAMSHLPAAALRRVRLLGTALAVGGMLAIVLGTVVTASGPHAGDPGTPRLGLSISWVARTHSTAVWLTIGVTVVLLLRARRLRLDRLTRAVTIVLALELVQGGVGYWQYLTGVPARLVLLHMLLACLFWVAVVRAAATAREAGAVARNPAAP